MHLSGQIPTTTNKLKLKREFDDRNEPCGAVGCLNNDGSNSYKKIYDGIEFPVKNKVLIWNELLPSLQFVLPPDDDYSYVIEEYDAVDCTSTD